MSNRASASRPIVAAFCALLLIVPGKTAFGAVLLACVMAGAVVAHLTVLHTAPTAPLVLFALTALIAWGRRTQFASLISS